MKNEYFGRKTECGNIAVLDCEGFPITRMDENIYPINSNLSARYEHSSGIIISIQDARKIGLEIEGDN